MLTGYLLSCTLGRSVLGIGSGVARFFMIAEYATYRYLRSVVNVKLFFVLPKIQVLGQFFFSRFSFFSLSIYELLFSDIGFRSPPSCIYCLLSFSSYWLMNFHELMS